MNPIDQPMHFSDLVPGIVTNLFGLYLCLVFFAGLTDHPRWILTFWNNSFQILGGVRWVSGSHPERERRNQLRSWARFIGGLGTFDYAFWALASVTSR
jgi:hypothetical protein